MVRAVLASALLAAAVAAAPSRYSANNYNYQQSYENCKTPQKQTWFDKNGVEYGWDDQHHVACLIVKDHYEQSYDAPSYNSYGKDTYQKDDYSYKKDDYSYKKDDYSYKPSHKTYYAAPSYDGYASEAKCDDKYMDRSYKECNESFEYAKSNYCSQYGSSGTKHGDCLTEVSRVKDQCIRAMDNKKPYCWDAKYLPEQGSYGGYAPQPSYEQPPSYNDGHQSYGKDENSYKKPDAYGSYGNAPSQPSYGQQPSYGSDYSPKKSYLSHDYDYTPSRDYYGGDYDSPYGFQGSYDKNSGRWSGRWADGTEGAYDNGRFSGKKSSYANYEPQYGYEQPKQSGYEPKYEQPKQSGYEPKYEQPKPSGYEPKYEQPEPKYEPSYEKPHGSGDCSSAKNYFESTGSPTLKQCVSIACAPGQTKAYIERALYQCYALEQQAKATNNGKLPYGW